MRLGATIAAFFLITSLIVSFYPTQSKGISSPLFGTSFHDSINGNKFWYAIKMELHERADINISIDITVSSKNGTDASRATFLMEVFYKPEGGYSCMVLIPNAYPSEDDHYFQIHFGFINFSSYHLSNDSGYTEVWVGGYSLYRNLSAGTYYLIYASYAARANVSFWINSTNNLTFSAPSKGNETFFYERHHFFGNINIGWSKGLIMLNGMKNIKAENTLFAIFSPAIMNGLSYLSYTNPSGEKTWRFEIYYNGFPRYRKGSGNFY